MLVVLFLTAFLIGLNVWFATRNDNQRRRQLVGNIVFQSTPTPRLQEAERMIQEQIKAEEARKKTSLQKQSNYFYKGVEPKVPIIPGR